MDLLHQLNFKKQIFFEKNKIFSILKYEIKYCSIKKSCMTGGSWEYPQGVQQELCADRLGSLEMGFPGVFIAMKRISIA